MPVLMSVVDVITAVLMRFQTFREVHGDVLSLSFYSVSVYVYAALFYIIGLCLFSFSVYCAISDRAHVFSRKNIKRKPWIPVLIAMLVWTGICTVFSDDPIVSFTGISGDYHPYFNGFSSILIFAAICAASMTIRSKKYRLGLIKCYCAVMTYLSVIVIFQALTGDLLVATLSFDKASVFSQHNHLGYALCMGIMGAMALYMFDDGNSSSNYKLSLIIAETIMILGLLINDTFGAYLAIMFSLVILWIIVIVKKKQTDPSDTVPTLIFAGMTLVNSLGFIPSTKPVGRKIIKLVNDAVSMISPKPETGYNNLAGTGRGYLWKETIRRIKLRPVFGYGPFGFSGDNLLMNGQFRDAPHNEFLQRAAYTGIPGLFLYLVMLLLWVHSFFKNIKKTDAAAITAFCITVTYLFSSVFGNPVFYTACYFYMFFGLSTVINENEEPAIEAYTPRLNEIVRSFSELVAKCWKKPVLLLFILMIPATGISELMYRNTEKNHEMADIATMKLAETFAMKQHMSGNLQRDQWFWFELETSGFIAVDDGKPKNPYGAGTEKVGNGAGAYQHEFKTSKVYGYDEAQDTRYSAVQIKITYEDGEPVIDMVWKEIPGQFIKRMEDN